MAEDAARYLRRRASAGRLVAYSDLMRRYGLSRGRDLTSLICRVDKAELERGAPGFAAIIVRKDSGLPGVGYFRDYDLPGSASRTADWKLTGEQRRHALEAQGETWAFYSMAPRTKPSVLAHRRAPATGKRAATYEGRTSL